MRGWELVHVEGDTAVMNAASLVKQVIAHLALDLIDDLDEPAHEDITVGHVLTHTSGLPNWRPEGQPLEPLRPPGQRWGYSGEGFVLSNATSSVEPDWRSRPLQTIGCFSLSR